MVNLNTTHKNFLFIVIIASIAALGGFIVGFDAGVIVDGKDQISALFSLSDTQWSLIACVSILGSFVTMPFSGQITDKIGVKYILIIAAILFVAALIFTATAHNLLQFITGRFVIGISIGIASFGAPLIIAGIAPPKSRGTLVLLNSIAITAGQTLSFLTAYYVHDLTPNSWRLVLWIEAICACIFFLGMLFIPQPSTKKQKLLHTENNTRSSYLKDVFTKKTMPVLVVGIGLAMFQQLVGINAVLYYGQVIFKALGFKTITEAIFATFCISLVNTLFTIMSAFFVDYLGRRIMLLIGTLLTAISMFLLGSIYFFSLGEKLALLFMGTYMIGYCISLGSLFWVLVSEIYPLKIRGSAMSFVISFQFVANLIVTMSFLPLFDFMGKVETFSLYGVMSVLAFLFIYFYVPETKNVSLEKIENNLNLGKKTRELGQV